jgi:hypothetical protein
MVVKIQVWVLWIVMPCSVAVGYQCFGGSCCLHFQGEVHGTGTGTTCIAAVSLS